MKNGKRILSVTVRQMYDESPDMSHLGEYGQRAESKYAIDRRHSEDCQSIQPTNDDGQSLLVDAAEYLDGQYPEGNELQEAMRESLGIRESIEVLNNAHESLTECDCNTHIDRNSFEFFNPNYQNYAGLPDEEIRKYCRQDYERAEALNRGEWAYIGIRAEAEIVLGKATVSFSPYLAQTIQSGGLWGIESDSGDYLKEIATEELNSLKDELRAIGFSARAISTAFKTIEHKEL